MPVEMTFGQVEALLAQINDIASDKRSVFGARLKNFLRMGLLPHVQQGRGKTASYGPAEVVTLALAVELTQFGLAPERVIAMLGNEIHHSIPMAVRMAAQGVEMFIHIQPQELASLTNMSGETLHPGFIHGPRDTTWSERRYAALNVGGLLNDIVRALGEDRRYEFLSSLSDFGKGGQWE
jgi:hypothetical protein